MGTEGAGLSCEARTQPPEPQARSYALPIDIRPLRERDLPFIYSTWIRHLGDLEPYRSLNKNWFSAAQHALIGRLLQRSEVLVACDPSDEDQIYGYIVGHGDRGPSTELSLTRPGRLLHWVYVKKGPAGGFRKAGVGGRLMEALFGRVGEMPITASTRTPYATELAEKWKLRFDSHEICEG